MTYYGKSRSGYASDTQSLAEQTKITNGEMAERIQAEASENQQNKGNKMKIQFIKKGISFIKVESASKVIFNVTREHAYIALWSIVKFLMEISDGDWIAIKNNVDSAIKAYRTERNRVNNNLVDLRKVEKEATKEINK